MTDRTTLPAWLPSEHAERLEALRASDPGFIRLPRVVALTGLSKSTVWDRSRLGTFPAPVKIGEHATAWKKAEVLAWMESRPSALGSVA